MHFNSCDFDPDSKTMIYEYDLKILKMYLHTRKALYRFQKFSVAFKRHSNTGRQTHRQIQPNALLHHICGW